MDMSHELNSLYLDGYCVLPSLIAPETCDVLKRYLKDRITSDQPYNFFKGHHLIPLPHESEFVPRDILFHAEIHKILHATLGDSYYLYSYNCNTILVDKNQPYHMDHSHLHPQNAIKAFGSPGPPHQVIANVYLEDTDESNGSFEVVPGSHLWTGFEIDEDGIIDDKYIKKSVRCNLPKGSIIVRDKRTWHRGTRNPSGNPRFMVGCGYSSQWFISNELEFDSECREIFDDAPFSTWNIKYSDS